ncbi:MAG TPA: hypothetical protein VMW43_12950 [Bacteroidota bacterium]|nr:hypothetical protein [Bacteroidota bacterium]
MDMFMRKVSAVLVAAVVILACGRLHAQLKSDQDQEVSASQTMLKPATSIGSFLGLLNSDNFMMRHNISMDFFSGAGGSLSIASYTNSMFYRIADPLNVRVDLTLQGTPFGQSGAFAQGDFNKLFVSRAELNYQPWNNTALRLEYNNLPLGYFGRYPYTGILPYTGGQ